MPEVQNQVNTEYTLTVKKWKLLTRAHLEDRLTKADLKCLAYLLESYNQKTGYAFPSYTKISEDLSLGHRQPKYSIIKLVELGYIDKVRKGGRGKANEYKPNFQFIKDWSPGWCDKKEKTVHESALFNQKRVHNQNKTVHNSALETVHSCAPETVHNSAPQPYPFNLSQLEPHTHNLGRAGGNGDDPINNDTDQQAVCVSSTLAEKSSKEANTQDLIREYIELASQKADNPGAYRASLEKKAKEGKLIVSKNDVEKLRGQDNELLF